MTRALPVRTGTEKGASRLHLLLKRLAQAERRGLGGIADQLAAGVDYIRKRHKAARFIAYFQMNTGTYAPTEYLRGIYNEALSSKDTAGIAISTRPDCLSDEMLDMLARLKGSEAAVAGAWASVRKRRYAGGAQQAAYRKGF